MISRPASSRSVPRWLSLALARSHRVGRSRVIVEAWLAVTTTLVVFGLALSPLAGLIPKWWHLVILALVSGLIVLPTMLTALPVAHALSSLRLRMRKMATHDERTGIVNRRHFTQMAYREWERCRRYRSGAALLMVEADNLQALEEERGRQARDTVMRSIALACDAMLRKPDLLGQHGAASLVVFLPHTDTLGAIDVAERIRSHVAQQHTPWQSDTLRVTVSVGVATLGDQHLSLNALVLDAESALLAAQDAGRNCVRTAPKPPSHRGRHFPVTP